MPNFEKVKYILHENDYISAMLTGSIATSPNTAGKSHINVKTRDYYQEIYYEVGLDPGIMPPVKPIGAVIGEITNKASKETGLPAGIPVINSVTDSTAGDISTGTLLNGQVNVNIGTTLVVHAVVNNLNPDPKGRIYYKNYLNNLYLAGGATNAGTIPMDAIKKISGLDHEQLDNMAKNVPAGSEGLMVQPQWIGMRIPESIPDLKGFITGITSKNFSFAHLYRATLEGNALVLCEVLDVIEKVTKTKIKEIRTCGGGAKSKVLNQVIADSTGRKVSYMGLSEPSIGSAIIAAWGYNGGKIENIAQKFLSEGETFIPMKENKKLYSERRKVLAKLTKTITQVLRGG